VNPKIVAIEILPDRLDLAVYDRGRRVNAARLAADLEVDSSEWPKQLRRLGAPLAAEVKRLGLVGRPVVVLYRSPTQAVDLESFDLRSSGQAAEAGILSCCEALSHPAMSTICEAVVVGRDQKGERRQTHVVAAAERDDVAAALVDLVEKAGLQFVSATPIEATIMARVAGEALRRRMKRGGLLYIGEHTSFFVVGGQGSMLFSRRIGLGLITLTRSLTRPIRVSGGQDAIELDMQAAREIVHRHGITAADTVVQEEHGLTQRQIIPLIQPVLQRFIVELRQSIRFGLPDDERRNLPIAIMGPGASMPGLAALLSDELGVEMLADERYQSYDWTEPGCRGSELADATRRGRILGHLNLLPQKLARQRRVTRLKRWMVTGAAAAVLIIALDALRFGDQLGTLRTHADALVSQTADIESLQVTAKRMSTALAAMNDLEKTILEEIGARISYRACLQEISQLTPDSIRFTSVRITRTDGRTQCNLLGFAVPDGSPTGQADLAAFVERLRRSPLFQDVVLGTVQIATLAGVDGRRFDIELNGVRAPFTVPALQADASAMEVSP
jgi:hypothetical protein